MSSQNAAGYIAWVRTVKEEIRFMVVDFNVFSPSNITWTDQVGQATIFQDPAQADEYFDQLRFGEPRRFMGKIFPSMALAIALDLESDSGQFEGWFGVSPFFFEPSMRHARKITVETKDDPDPQFNTSNEQRIRSIPEFVEFLVSEARRAGKGKKLVVTKADFIREFNPRPHSGDARRVIEALSLRPDVNIKETILSVAGVRIEFEYKEGT